MKKTGKRFPPRIECEFLSPTPCGKEYICGALTELFCATRGKCKFFKSRTGKEGR